MNSLGKRVKMMREKLNLKQEEVAKITSISRSNIGKIENDQIIPNCNAALELAKLFNVTTDWLITGTERIDIKRELEILTGDVGRLSDLEVDIVLKFRELDSRDQEDIRGTIDMKYERTKHIKKGRLSTCRSGGGGSGEEAATKEYA